MGWGASTSGGSNGEMRYGEFDAFPGFWCLGSFWPWQTCMSLRHCRATSTFLGTIRAQPSVTFRITLKFWELFLLGFRTRVPFRPYPGTRSRRSVAGKILCACAVVVFLHIISFNQSKVQCYNICQVEEIRKMCSNYYGNQSYIWYIYIICIYFYLFIKKEGFYAKIFNYKKKIQGNKGASISAMYHKMSIEKGNFSMKRAFIDFFFLVTMLAFVVFDGTSWLYRLGVRTCGNTIFYAVPFLLLSYVPKWENGLLLLSSSVQRSAKRIGQWP